MSRLCKELQELSSKIGIWNMGLLRNIRRPTVVVVCILLLYCLSATAQTDDAEDGAYIGSARSDKYHLPTCKWAQKISQRNAVYFQTVEAAQAAGYISCRVCLGTMAPSVRKPQPMEPRAEQQPAQRPQRRDPERRVRPGWSGDGIPTWIYWLVGILLFLGILVTVFLRDWKAEKGLNDWLDQHFQSLSQKQQRELTKLRDGYRSSRPRYGRSWPETSQRIRKQRPRCEVCGAASRHVHHKRYRRFRDRPGDLIALCDMCHYWIHPRTNMTREAFNQTTKRG